MKSQNFPMSKGLQPFVFCIGVFLLAMSFTVVVCFSTFYAFHSISSDAGVAKSGKAPVSGWVSNMYASVK